MQKELKYCSILGTNINVTTMQETVEYIDENLESLRGNYICVSNVHTTMIAFRDKEYQKIQNGGAMALPDGKPLSLVCHKRGILEAGRVPGPDLMPRIFEISEERGYRHYFYGSSTKTIVALEKALKERYPRLKIVGMFSPPFRAISEEEDNEQIETINASQPDFIWVGLGAPKQEQWMAQHKNKVSGLMLGVGAGFDFHAGTIKRAPNWMQELCLEWLFRLSQDPIRLLPRYLNTNVSFLYHVRKENKTVRKQNRTKRIAIIGHKRIPSREGGIEIVVEELATRYVKLGYKVDVYNRSGYHVSGKEYASKNKKEYKGIHVITIPTLRNGKLNAIVYSFLASIRVLFGHYGVIHYHAEGPCAMLWIPKIFRKKIVVTIHGLDWQRAKWGNFASYILKFGEKMAVKYADEIIVLSLNVQSYFRAKYGRETIFIPNGINKPEIIEAEEITQKYGLKKDDYVLFLARLVPEKGVHYLIEAFSKIHTNKKLVIAGGSSNSLEYWNQIIEATKQDDRMIMTGFCQGKILEELYSNSYIFVLPSEIEGMAISLLEAMSYGNCCVVSDINENIEVVEEHAVSFHSTVVADLQRTLEELLSDSEKVEEYKNKSRDFILSKYHWDDVVDKTLKAYQKAIQG